MEAYALNIALMHMNFTVQIIYRRLTCIVSRIGVMSTSHLKD